MPIGDRDTLLENDKFIMYGELVRDPPHEPKYHIWVYSKNRASGFSDEELTEIIKNLKDYGKWGEYKKLKKELNGNNQTTQ